MAHPGARPRPGHAGARCGQAALRRDRAAARRAAEASQGLRRSAHQAGPGSRRPGAQLDARSSRVCSLRHQGRVWEGTDSRRDAGESSGADGPEPQAGVPRRRRPRAAGLARAPGGSLP